MKNHFFYTLFMLFFASSAAFSQCQAGPLCESVDLDFQTSGNGANISHLPDWTYSHGSPSVGAGGFWLWSYNNKGEGINYSGYNFIAGNQYTICFVANTSTHNGASANPNAAFKIVGTNSPVGGYNTSTSSSPIPAAPASSQDIVNANWNATFPNPGTGTYTYTFTATGNWNNLWIHPSSQTLPQVEIGITSIVICEVEPCDASFTVCLTDYGSGQSGISTTLNNSNHTLVHMDIEENGVQVYSGAPISYIGTAGKSYQICVIAVNNNTGEECRKCYAFCISKTKGDIFEGKSTGTLINSVQIDSKKSSMPDEFKDKPLEKDLGVIISPNPSNRLFDISSSFNENKIATVNVYDLNSRQVYSSELNENKNNARIDLKDQPAGIYLVKIKHADGSISQEKIVLEK